MVGGNGPNVTWRLAVRHADELNLDGMTPDETARALPVIRSRCEEIGRDPASLRVSVFVWSSAISRTGAERIDLLSSYQDVGIDRVMGEELASPRSDEALEALAEDVRAAGLEMAPSLTAGATTG